jgi:hypothetical protein
MRYEYDDCEAPGKLKQFLMRDRFGMLLLCRAAGLRARGFLPG